jgi:hypothetical protein
MEGAAANLRLFGIVDASAQVICVAAALLKHPA